MLTFKHEAFLAFVERLLHDREFSEWFVSQPGEALATHSLSVQDLQEVNDVLQAERYEPNLSRALRPTLSLLLEVIREAHRPEDPNATRTRLARLEDELGATRLRVSEARTKSRPWWKFW